MPSATGTIDITGMHEDAFHERHGEPRLARAGGTQRFNGSIAGDGVVEWLACYGVGRARLIGLQRVDGTLDGRRGTFVVEATSDHDGTRSTGTWRIVDGSGTGELAGIRGSGAFEAGPGGATYRLDYELG